jgi:hypothetical protein
LFRLDEEYKFRDEEDIDEALRNHKMPSSTESSKIIEESSSA